jgi:hypothetical protein
MRWDRLGIARLAGMGWRSSVSALLPSRLPRLQQGMGRLFQVSITPKYE